MFYKFRRTGIRRREKDVGVCQMGDGGSGIREKSCGTAMGMGCGLDLFSVAGIKGCADHSNVICHIDNLHSAAFTIQKKDLFVNRFSVDIWREIRYDEVDT